MNIFDIFELNYEANPPLFIIAKSGQTHIFVGAPLPRGGMTRALCDTRPPLFGGDPLEMFQILPSLFHAVEEVAPQHWQDLQRHQESVSCERCRLSLKQVAEAAWNQHGLMDYTHGYGFDLDQVKSLIAAIPAGRWAGQSDVAEACGGYAGSGFAVRRLLNIDQDFAREHGSRVLYDDGSGGDRDTLGEGISFGVGPRVADPAKRLTLDELKTLCPQR